MQQWQEGTKQKEMERVHAENLPSGRTPIMMLQMRGWVYAHTRTIEDSQNICEWTVICLK